MRVSFVVWVAIAGACGGTTSGIDGGGVDASTDGSPADSGSDVIALDAAECTPPGGPCANPCPSGTYCLKASGPTEANLGCTPIPPECNGTPSCACMTDCFCAASRIDMCMAGQGYLICNNGTLSRRAFKKDIDYVPDAERAELARDALAIPLARYRYKTEPESQSRHLGFIIDDQPAECPAVAADGTHVDLYGYTSMLLAAVQEQQKQIDALKKQVDALEKRTRDAQEAGRRTPMTAEITKSASR